MKIYGMLFVALLSTIFMYGMQEDNSGKFLSIQKRMEELRQEQSIVGDVDHEIQAELQRLDEQIKLYQAIDLETEIKQLTVLIQKNREKLADAEWEIED